LNTPDKIDYFLNILGSVTCCYTVQAGIKNNKRRYIMGKDNRNQPGQHGQQNGQPGQHGRPGQPSGQQGRPVQPGQTKPTSTNPHHQNKPGTTPDHQSGHQPHIPRK
jgi:hypothetical protein